MTNHGRWLIVPALVLAYTCAGCTDHPVGSLRATRHWKPILREDSGGLKATTILHDLVFATRQRGWIVRETLGGQGISYELLRTEDGGTTWRPETFTAAVMCFRGPVGWAIEYRYRDDLSRLPNRIWRTVDAGRSWACSETRARDYVALSVVSDVEAWGICQPPVTLYAQSPRAGVLHTRDGGQTWQEVALPRGDRTAHACGLFFLDGDHGWIIIVAEPKARQVLVDHQGRETSVEVTRTVLKSILRTANGGKTFEETTVELVVNGIPRAPRVRFNDASEGWAAFGDTSLLHSTDGGDTWQRVVPKLTRAPSLTTLYDVSFPSRHDGWAVGGRVLRTSDAGKTWKEVETGADIEDAEFTEVAFVDTRNGWIVGEGGYGPNDMTMTLGHRVSYVLRYAP